MKEFVRVCALAGYLELVSELGGDSHSLLKAQHIDPATLSRDDNLITFKAMVRLLEASAKALGCPTFGLRLAEKQGIQCLGPIALIGLNSATVGEALRKMLAALDFHSPATLSSIDEKTDPGCPRITFDLEIPDVAYSEQLFEMGIGNIFHELRALTETRFVPAAIFFRHSCFGDASFYKKYFKCPIHFNSEVNAVGVNPEVLSTRIDAANPQMQQLVMEYVRQATQTYPLDVVGQVRFLIKQFLPVSTFGLKDVARNLCMHIRTLQRKLKQEGLIYGNIVDDIRAERAKELLRKSNMAMSQIALALGYQEQASFNHACMRWFGSAPSKVRQLPQRSDIL